MLNALRLVGVEAYEVLGDSIYVVAVLCGESDRFDVEGGIVEGADDGEIVAERFEIRPWTGPLDEVFRIGAQLSRSAATDDIAPEAWPVHGGALGSSACPVPGAAPVKSR